MEPVTPDDFAMEQLNALGWRTVTMPAGCYPHLKADHTCLDYGGWPLYTRASLPDEDVYRVCAALQERQNEILWESSFTGIDQLWKDTEATPLDVPLHPGAEKWCKEQGYL